MKTQSKVQSAPFTTTDPGPHLASQPVRAIEQVYEAEADFVWRSLQRLGVRGSDLDDVFQDVFEIVQRGIAGFRGEAPLRSWLFGICLRQAKRQRRLSWFRREPVELAGSGAHHLTPEREAQAHEELAILELALRPLNPEQRAVFTMCEIERMSGEEVAAILAVPVGTVYSRLHSARKKFQNECLKLARRGLLSEREK